MNLTLKLLGGRYRTRLKSQKLNKLRILYTVYISLPRPNIITVTNGRYLLVRNTNFQIDIEKLFQINDIY